MTEIPVIGVCPECGSPLQRDYEFCPACGRMYDKNITSSPLFQSVESESDREQIANFNRVIVEQMRTTFMERMNRSNVLYLAIWVAMGLIGSAVMLFFGEQYLSYVHLSMTLDQVHTIGYFYIISVVFAGICALLSSKKVHWEYAFLFCAMSVITVLATLTCNNPYAIYFGVLGALVTFRVYRCKPAFKN
ncbi:MAG: zinc-ribbon domain-containing protein [archaeon]|nr:zinc-ribbon domain-containing protein [archaeon]